MERRVDLPSALSVYLIADAGLTAKSGRPLEEMVERAIEGGVTAVQLRAKELPAVEQWELGRRLRALTASLGIPFFVNDRIDLALALDADGAHIGEEDLPVAAARRLALAASRPEFVIGFSTAVLEWARQAVAAGADYVSVGNLFGTTTKPDAGRPIGLGPLTEIAREIPVPVIGIGGITDWSAPLVIEAGGAGVAVAAHVIESRDPAAAARSLAQAVERAKEGAAAAAGDFGNQLPERFADATPPQARSKRSGPEGSAPE